MPTWLFLPAAIIGRVLLRMTLVLPKWRHVMLVLHRVQVNYLVSDLIEFFIEFLYQVFVRSFNHICLVLLTVLLIILIVFDLSILLQSFLSIFNQLLCILTNLRSKFGWLRSILVVAHITSWWLKLLPVLTLLFLNPRQTRRRLLQSWRHGLIVLVIDQSLHFLFQLLLFKPFLSLLKEQPGLFVDLWHPLLLFLLHLFLLRNLLFNSFLLKESLLIGDECIHVSDMV